MPLDPQAWQMFGQGIASWRDRRDRDADQKIDRERLARLDQMAAEQDAIQRQLIQQQLASHKFNLGEAQKGAKAKDALINFDPSQFTEMIPLPPEFQGPPAPGATADVSKPFHAQSPAIQQQILSSLIAQGVSAPETAQAFNARHVAQTGQPVVPPTPPGMQPSEVSIDGFKFEPKIELPADARPSSTRVGNTTYDFPPPPAVPAQVQPVLDAAGNAMPGLYTGPDGKAHPLPRTAAPTEAQSNARIYSERMKFIEEQLNGPNGLAKRFDPTSLLRLPELEALRYLRSDDANAYTDAKRNWIAAALRKESGAAISNPEYANADKQYFPQVGDGPEAIERKRQLRELVRSEMETIGSPPQVELPFSAPQGQPQAPQPQAPGPASPVPVNSQAEYDALPPGSWYVDSTGIPKQKKQQR